MPTLYFCQTLCSTGPNLTFPVEFEEEILENPGGSLDLVMYTISPTISSPATYPMLDPDEDEIDEEERAEGGGASQAMLLGSQDYAKSAN